MKYGFLLAVKDISTARRFYEELFGLQVVDDFGRNIAFDCGLSLQQDFDWLTGLPKEEMKEKENNCELFFEVADFKAFVEQLKARTDITFLHDIMEQSWGQQVIRFYDLDSHLIEVAEPMKSVVIRFQSQGMSMEEITEKMDVTAQDIQRFLQN